MPTFADQEDGVRAALVNVAENSFFGFTVPLDDKAFDDLVRHPLAVEPDVPPGPGPWIVTEVPFAGPFDGAVEVAMSEVLARQLLQAFLGLGLDDPIDEGQLFDATGEFANQVCGTWLTRASGDRRFDLGAPDAVRRPLGWLPLDSAPSGDCRGEILVSMNDLPLRVRVRLAAEAA